jgi:hypothetical protein
MANFWDNIGQNNINNFQQNSKQNFNGKPNLLQFIAQNRGKTLDQMLREYNLNVSEEDIQAILPEAKKLLDSLRLK